MTLAEASVEETLRVAVEAAGGRCIKLNPLWYRGIPDRLVLLPGARVFFIELKKEGARTKKHREKHQSAWRIILSKLGFNCLLISGKPELKEFIDVHVRR